MTATRISSSITLALAGTFLFPHGALADHDPPGSLVGLDLRLFAEPAAEACGHAPGGGGAATIRFYGRVVSRRPMVLGEEQIPPIIEGVDTITVQVWDRDSGDDTLIWSGFTDSNGCFDSGILPRLEQLPDVYLRVVADSPNLRIDEHEIGTYAWNTDDDESALFFPDFAGDELNFGAARPSIPILPDYAWAILQIHNTITRAERWLRVSSGLGIDLPKVIVREPHYAVSFYDILTDDIVHAGVGIEGLADERTYLHHYAHFLQGQFGSVLPDDCIDQQGCVRVSPWCEAVSPAKAWQEGFGDWFADVIIERLGEIYTIDGGEPWQPAGGGVAPFEHVEVCPDTGEFAAPLESASGMFTAFLFDMTDGHMDPEWFFAQDDEKLLVADNYSDCSRSGWFEILDVTTQGSLPMTPDEFVADYAVSYPLQRPALYWTAFNITPDYLATAVFPDASAPGVVPEAGSRQVGSSPCIPLVVDPPADDGTGACSYSWEWTMNPGGAVPDFTADVFGSCTLPGPMLAEGDWYVSIRARDCANNWSAQYATFGPFEIRDCNANGVVDACEVGCDENMLRDAYDCDIPLDLCDSAPCIPNDCNGNLTPDDCDIAEGISTDCNQDDIPDDCQEDTVRKWVGPFAGSWQVPENWSPLENGGFAVPTAETDVCITSDQDQVIIQNHAAKAKSVFSAGDVWIIGTSFSSSLEINGPSFFEGELALDGPQARAHAADLEVDTVKMPNSGELNGLVKITNFLDIGASNVKFGRAFLADSETADGDFTIASTASAEVNGTIFYNVGNERVFVESGGTFTFNGDGTIINNFGLLENDGTFTRASGSSNATIFCDVINRGTIDVLTGNLSFSRPLTNSGTIAGQTGTTVSISGGTTFTPTSQLEAGTLLLAGGGISVPILIQGTVDLKDGFVGNGPQTTVDASTTVIDYGTDLIMNTGQLTLQPVLNAELVFDTLTAHGTIRFESGDPVRANNVSLQGQNIRDVSLLTVVNSFTIRPAGGMVDAGLVTKGMTQLIPDNAVKPFFDTLWTNEGTILLDNGFALKGDSKLINAQGATIDIANTASATLIADETALPTEEKYSIENDGQIIKSTAASGGVIGPSLWNRGDFIVDMGPITLSNFLRQTAGRTILNGGSITMFTSPSRFFRLQGGRLGGTNSFIGRVENTGGSVRPGEMLTGPLTIDGDYVQSDAGELLIQLEGTNPGVDHDQLIVTGLADIQGGHLTVERLNNFTPPVGTPFVILTGSSVQGAFTQIDAGGAFDVTVNPSEIVIIFRQPADLDGDGDVDQDDFDLFAACASGPMVPLAPGCENMDFDGDGDVDQVDFGIMQLCFSGPNVPADPTCAN